MENTNVVLNPIRGKRKDFLKITITLPPETLANLKRLGIDRKLQGQRDTDVSSLIRESLITFLHLKDKKSDSKENKVYEGKMASIKKVEGEYGESFQVRMRTKENKQISKTFKDYETAYIWSKYKETVTKERIDFDADPNDQYTILDVMLAKYGEESREFKESMDYFIGIANTFLGSLTYENMLEHSKYLLSKKVKRGGSKKNDSGTEKLPEPMTVLRKFAYLSAAISFMQKNGVNLDNNAAKVVTYLREIDKKRKENGKA